MTSIVQGESGTLTANFYEYAGGPAVNVTGLTITITPIAGGAAVVGPTAVGITNPATGLYGYIWAVGSGQAAGDYAAVWNGTYDGDPVQASEVVTVTAAAVAGAWYSDLATLKLTLSITDTDRDDLLEQALATASRAIETFAGGRVFNADATASARTFPVRGRSLCVADGERLLVDDISTTTGLIVEIGTGSTFTAVTDYEVGPENAISRGWPITSLLRLGGTWSSSVRPRVRVTAKWGWPAVPDQVVQATLIQASRLYKRKDSPEGVMGNAEWGTVRVSRVDPDVQALLQPFVVPGFA
jgi:hypothetical protein